MTSTLLGTFLLLAHFILLFLQGRLLLPDHHPLHHPGLLHGAHRQPPAEKNGGGEDQTEESCVRGHVRRGRLLLLLPALCHRQSGAAERQAAAMAGGGGRRGSGVRQPHGFVVPGLPAGPAGVLLL